MQGTLLSYKLLKSPRMIIDIEEKDLEVMKGTSRTIETEMIRDLTIESNQKMINLRHLRKRA